MLAFEPLRTPESAHTTEQRESKKRVGTQLERTHRVCVCVSFEIVSQLFISVLFAFYFSFYVYLFDFSTNQKTSLPFVQQMLCCVRKSLRRSPPPSHSKQWCSSAFVYRFNNHHFEWLILFFRAINATAYIANNFPDKMFTFSLAHSASLTFRVAFFHFLSRKTFFVLHSFLFAGTTKRRKKHNKCLLLKWMAFL